jgi:predicted unusual protein kinase regulating ubiquinone biosynthesis (AarF/ABC1/UbiB family)
MTDERKLPEGRLGRLARLAGAGLRAGASLVGDSDGKDAARNAAEVFGTLRGLAAKVGQMASYVDGVVPEGQRAAYETAMKGLRAAAPTSNWAEIQALLEEELKAPLDEAFVRFDPTPIASASIGQVHRAWIAPEKGERDDAVEVAVKVQHPGIVKAIDADLANAGMLQLVLGSVVGKKFKTKEQLEMVKQRFREELDYGLEAERLALFRGFHLGDDSILLPRVHRRHSTTRVLTTDFMHGASFDDACAADARERRLWAETLWRFVYKGNLVHGLFNADPHPGNYLFRDGAVVFLDFGCVQPIPSRNLGWARKMHRAAQEHDERAFTHAFMNLLQAPEGALAKTAAAYTRLCFEPLWHRPYRMTRPYVVGIVERTKEMALEARKVSDDEFFAMPEEMLFVNRLQFGFYSVLARLDVEADYSGVERAFWHEVEAASRA